jgi:hypothetical protein
MQPLSKGFYLGSILGGLGLGGLLIIIGIVAASEDPGAGLAFMCFGCLPMIYGAVVVCVLIYKLWAAIQDGRPRTTPGKAVGFLFIPFYNFYWGFQAYWGWTQDFNRYVGERNIPAPRMPEGLALTICILILATMIPFVGSFIVPVHLVLYIVFFNSAINGVNALAAARAAAPAAAAAAPGAVPSLTCRNCGQVVTATAAFCPTCGQSLRSMR